MTAVAIAGLGKMGLSHLAILKPHPDVDVVGVCDAASYVLDVLRKHTGAETYSDYEQMLDRARPDAVLIATPSHLHEPMVRAAVVRNIHVFCEKPLFLDPVHGVELTRMATERGLVTQVGYHNRYVEAFREVKRLLDSGAIGTVTDALAEAYGPVVLKPAGRSWRTTRTTGGGCLYDYAAHPLDLLTWYLGEADSVSGSVLRTIFSKETDDAVATTLHYPTGATAQLHANWSDESQRKMTTRITIWGTGGRICADRQEIQVFLRGTDPVPEGYRTGWTIRYTTELTEAPSFYLRGEEYSSQLEAFVRRVSTCQVDGPNTFKTGSATDRVIDLIARDAAGLSPGRPAGSTPSVPLPTAALNGTRGVRASRRSMASLTRTSGAAARQAIESARRGITPLVTRARTTAARAITRTNR
jgi:scyllo-inositol 2-dehydrogenase (NADP+)